MDKVRMKLGLVPMDTEETNKTADSTFKPKSLRNRAKERADALVAADREREEAEEKKRRRDGGSNRRRSEHFATLVLPAI